MATNLLGLGRAQAMSYSGMGYLLLFVSVVIILTSFFLPSNVDTKIAGRVELDDAHHSEEVFRIDYAEMERNFKIYVYPHGDDYGATVGKYASVGYFFKNIRESHFLTYRPHQAHMFFVPISLQRMHQKASSIAGKYVKSIILEYPYWNRTLGADHFFVTCLDQPHTAVPMFMKNSIRVVCSSTYKSDAATFIPHKDVTIPSVMLPYSRPASTGNDLHQRTILGYWAGAASSGTRKRLVNLWGADDELDIQNTTTLELGGGRMVKFRRAKFCICPVGSRSGNSRITMAIHYGCVPVILDDYLDLPFNDVLNWGKFSVVIKEREVHRLKGILKAAAGGAAYGKMYTNLLEVQRHFEWNAGGAVRYDAFHMVMYDLWLRRHAVRY